MSNTRPSDTLTPLLSYLWWLLPQNLKKKDVTVSIVGKLLSVWGEELESFRTLVGEIVTEYMAETASGSYLDRLARFRQLARTPGETDASLRVRVLAALDNKRKGGTIPGMIAGLLTLGYTATIEEPNDGTPTWSRFVIRLTAFDGTVENQGLFYQIVNELKPAHTRPLIESELLPGTWDDWEDGVDDPLLLDEGQLDDWLIT